VAGRKPYGRAFRPAGQRLLSKLEYSIQRANGRPLGWIADAVSDGHAEIHKGEKPNRKGTKFCPAPGCDKDFGGNDWDGIDAHWRAEHTDVCSYENFWHILQNIEVNASPNTDLIKFEIS
jgi:hypothetical protein